MALNLDEYFARRMGITPGQENTVQESPIEKVTAPVATENVKTKLLQTLDSQASGLTSSAARRRAEIADLAQKNKDSLVNLIGLEPDGVAAQVLNMGASVASGATRLAGNIAALPTSLAAQAETSALGDPEFAAHMRYKNGNASPEDMALLNSVPKSGFTLGDVNRAMEGQFGDATVLQRIEQSDSQRNAARSINDAFDISKRVEQTRRTAFSKDLTKNFESNWTSVKDGWDGNDHAKVTTGIVGLLTDAGRAAISNPGAVSEYIAENIPQLAVGALGNGGKAAMIAGNIGYAADAYQKGIEKYQAENNGSYPSEAERERMALFAASLAVAEQLGDVSLLKGAKAAIKPAQATLTGAVAKTLGATASGVASEAATEGYQTYAEGEAGLKPATAKDIYEGAVIGGLVGGSMSGAPRAVGEAVQLGSQVATKMNAPAEAVPGQKKALEDAIASGDVSTFTDPKTPLYAPEKAVAALYGNAQKVGTPEAKQENLVKAEAIVSGLQTERAKAQEAYETVSPEAIASNKAALEAKKAELSTIDPADTAAIAQATEVIGLFEEQIADQIAGAESVTRIQTKMSKLDRQIQEAQSVLETFVRDVQGKDVDVAQEVAAVKTSTEAADKIVNLSMVSPENMDAQTAISMADDTSNALTTDQRTYFRSFGAARIAENAAKSMDEVSQEVFTGSKQNLGIQQYRSMLASALAAGNKEQADVQLKGIARFQEAHANKAAIAAQAWKQGKGTPIAKNRSTNAWEIVASPVKGGLVINSERLVEAIQLEADAISKANTELQAAYAVKFNKSAATPVTTPVASSTATATTATPVANAVSSARETTSSNNIAEGTLSKISNKEVDDLITKNVTQVANKEGDATQRPLVAVKDFISKLKNNTVAAKDYLSEGTELTERQESAIKEFISAVDQWKPTILANLVEAKNPAFNYNDMMKFFVDSKEGKLSIEENLVSAMVYAGFSYVAENATRPLVNSDEEINNILQRDETASVSNLERKVLGHIGVRQNVMINALGQRVVQALGLKVSDSAPINTKANLESHLGAHVLKMLIDEDMVQRNEIPGKRLALLTKNTGTSEFANFQFISMDQKNADSVYQALKGTQGVLDKLFGVEAGLKEPSITPIPFNQKTTRNTNQKVPSNLAEVVAEKNAEANYVRQDMWQLITQMDDNILLNIAGAESVSAENTHVVNRPSIQAKNDGLKRELDRFKEYVGDYLQNLDDGLDTPMYFEHGVWKQQRVGINTNAVNPQTSKIHRHMLFRQSWATKVDVNNAEAMDNFRLRVLEGLGVKTDKQANVNSLASFESKTSNADIKAAVSVLRTAIYEGGMDQAAQKTLEQGVKVGGEKFHSLDALVALAHYEQAIAERKSTFTTHLMGEVDGVTNGPMLSHLMLGAAPTVGDLFGLLNRGGFYEVGNDQTQYNQWRGTPGNSDLYETTTLHMMKNVAELEKGKNGKQVKQTLAAISVFTGTLIDNGTVQKAGRNIIKTPLTAMVFGSSVSSAVDSMADNFVDSIYTAMEDTVTGKQSIDSVVNALASLGVNIPNNNLLETEFTDSQVKTLKDSFKNTLGKAVANTMQQDFAVFIENRKQLNKAADVTFKLYDAAYQGMREQLVAELVKNGEIAVNGKGVPTQDITAKQDRTLRNKLKAIAPIMHSAMSKDAGELDAGLYMSKAARKLGTRAGYTGEIQFGTPFKDNTKSTKVRGYEPNESAPGVAMVPISAHSADSAISHYAAKGNEVLNVHDAHGTGVGGFQKAAQNLNQATWKTMLGYSPANEVADALTRTVTGLASLVKDGTLPESSINNIVKALEDFATKEEIDFDIALETVMTDTRALAYRADSMKLDAMAQMNSVDQYALEGGNYVVTDKDRQSAVDLKNSLEKKVNTDVVAAVDTINKALTGAYAPSKETNKETVVDTELDARLRDTDVLNLPSAQTMQLLESLAKDDKNAAAVLVQMEGGKNLKDAVLAELKESDAANMVQLLSMRYNMQARNAWGNVGEPRIPVDPALAELFEKDNVITAAKIIPVMYKNISNTPDSRAKTANLKILKMLQKTVKQDLRIRYITPATPTDLVLEKPATKARGWYVAKNDYAQEIYLLGKDFINAGITNETVMHELIHSALVETVDREYRERKFDSNYKSDALELVDELEALRVKAKEFITKSGSNKFLPAVENIHEVIAWGMTNQEFQRSVLNQVSIKSKTQGNSLIKGMKAFIQNIVGILFKGSSKTEKEIESNGVAVLIGNVSGLFYQAAQVKNASESADVSTTNLAQAAAVDNYNTIDIYEALGKTDKTTVTTEFDTKLRDLLTGIVDKLHGPFGSLKEEAMTQQAGSPLDVWLKALDTGEAPFASAIMASGFNVTSQEAYVIEQVEATVKAALTNNEAFTKISYRELSEVYQQAYRKLSVEDFHNGDWSKATTNEKEAATALYDFVFNIEKGANDSDRSDYLARFAALGLAHEGFAKLLQQPSDVLPRGKVTQPGLTLAQRLNALFESILTFFNGKVSGTYAGQPLDSKLKKLVDNLVDIEAKKRHSIKRAATATNYLEPVENAVRNTTEALRKKAGAIADSNFVRNSKNGFIAGAGGIVRTISNDRVEAYVEGLKRLRDKEFKGREGLVAGILTDAMGPKEVFNTLLRATKNGDRLRKNIITETARTAMNTFAESGKNLTGQSKAAISALFLRTGAHVLLDHFNMNEIQELVEKKEALGKAIDKFEAQLDSFGLLKAHYIDQANALGYYKATGKVKVEVMMMNAHNIARLHATNIADRVTEEQASKAEPIIDVLTTLYAMEYADSVHKAFGKEVIKTENARKDGNGIEFVLKLHKQLEQDSKERLFGNNSSLMMKGYTPEILNPHIEVKIANAEDGKDLIDQGYVKGSLVSRDPADPEVERKNVYVLKDGGLAPRLTGIISYTGKNAKGSKRHNGFLNPNYALGINNLQIQQAIDNVKKTNVQKSFKPGPRKDLSKVEETYMAPVVNERGDIVNWRYMMAENTKNSLLERDNRFEKILGALAGSIFDKETTAEQNEKAITAAKALFDEEYATNASSYTEIKANSPDKEMRELWALLPDETKAAVRKIWGYDGMKIRTDSLDIMFGYRKVTAANVFKMDASDRNGLQNLFVSAMEWNLKLYGKVSMGLNEEEAKNYAKRAAMIVTKGERAWQEIVRETKDIIVVKSGIVMIGNIWSNFSVLALSGVSLKEQINHHLVAMKGATAYLEDSKALSQLKLMQEAGYTDGTQTDAEMTREINRLEDAIARNPVKELIDAGLMPTIVEDIAADDDIYSYKSAFVRKTEKYTSKVNPMILGAAKQVYMSHDTTMYKTLSRVTQLSDFVARYTLYQHLIARKKNPLSKEAAIAQASDYFINYDIPMHRNLQYTDDMGLTMFTKYFIRIQRVLLKIARENPARVLAALAMHNLLGLDGLVTDSSFMGKIGNNPMHGGAFQYFGSLDDLATVHNGMALIK